MWKKRTNSKNKTSSYDISMILKLNGKQFINTAFFAFNGENAPKEIYNQYKERMLRGMTKKNLISKLCINRNKDTKYRGLWAIIILYRIRKIPFLGTFLIFLNNYLFNGLNKRRLRIIENAIFFQNDDLIDKIKIINKESTVDEDNENTIYNIPPMPLRISKAYFYLIALKKGGL